MDEKKPYEFRILQATDIFAMVKLIKAFGIANFKKCFNLDDIKKIVAKSKDDESEKKDDDMVSIVGFGVVFDIIEVIVENLGNCEDEIYTFLSNVSNLNKKEIETLPARTFMQMLVDFFKKEEFVGFFKEVSELLK